MPAGRAAAFDAAATVLAGTASLLGVAEGGTLAQPAIRAAMALNSAGVASVR